MDYARFGPSMKGFLAGLARVQDMEGLISSYLTEMMGDAAGEKGKVVLAACQAHQHLLPKVAGDYIFVASTINALAVASAKVAQSPGNAPGFLEVTSLLADAERVASMKNPLTMARSSYESDRSIVMDSWKKALKTLLERCDSASEAEQYLEKTKDVDGFIAEWKEESFPQWLMKGEDKDTEYMHSKVEQLVAQFPTWRKQLERASQLIPFASEEDRAVVKNACDNFPKWQKAVDDTTIRVSTMLVAAAVLQKPSGAATEEEMHKWHAMVEYALKFSAKNLQVKVCALPAKLREQLPGSDSNAAPTTSSSSRGGPSAGVSSEFKPRKRLNSKAKDKGSEA